MCMNIEEERDRYVFSKARFNIPIVFTTQTGEIKLWQNYPGDWQSGEDKGTTETAWTKIDILKLETRSPSFPLSW